MRYDDQDYIIDNREKNLASLNTRLASKGEPVSGLKDVLNRRPVALLRRMAMDCEIRGRSKMKKKDLVDALCTTIAEPEFILDVLSYIDQQQWDFIRSLIAENSYVTRRPDPGQYIDAYLNGIVAVFLKDGSFTFIIPDEIYAIIKTFSKKKLSRRRNRINKIDQLLSASVNLYGLVTYSDFIDIYYHYAPKKHASEDQVFDDIARLCCYREDYSMNAHYIYHPYFDDIIINSQDHYYQAAQTHKRYLPDLKDFLPYSDPLYYEQNVNVKAFNAFLCSESLLEPDEADFITFEVVMLCRVGWRFQEIIDEVMDMIPSFDPENEASFEFFEQLAQLIVQINNSSRMWLDNGHSPNELSKNRRGRFQNFTLLEGGSPNGSGDTAPPKLHLVDG